MIPEISIITATYEPEIESLQRTIDSVASQCGVALEHLIIDGGSKNFDLSKIVTRNEDLKTISWWVSEPDDGIYEAFNKGIKKARGKWLLFLGAGDTFVNNGVLERMLPILHETPQEIRIVYGKAWSGHDIPINQNDDWEIYRTKVRRDGFFFAHQAVFHRAALFEEYGGYDESFRILADNELLRRELMEHEARSVDFAIAIQPYGGLNSSLKNLPRFLKESMRIYRRYPLQAGFHHRIRVGTQLLIEFLETRFESRWAKFLSWFYLRPFLFFWSPCHAWREYCQYRSHKKQ